jgi:hypothetical protein
MLCDLVANAQSYTGLIYITGIDLGGWAGDYNIQITDFCRILVLLYRIPEHSQYVTNLFRKYAVKSRAEY